MQKKGAPMKALRSLTTCRFTTAFGMLVLIRAVMKQP